MFLIPIFPEDALCTLAGITPLKYKEFIFMQLISRPTSIISTLIFLTGDIIPFNAFTITMTIILSFLLIIIFIKCYKNADKITSFVNNYLDKISKNKRKTKKRK
mgnify:CR=1 FL=1